MAAGTPWWAKIVAKLALSRLPVDYRQWVKLRIFRHGSMADPQYALGVFRNHLAQACLQEEIFRGLCLEIGPGDSLLTAVAAHAAGFSGTLLVDTGAWAQRNVQQLRAVAVEEGVGAERTGRWTTFEEALTDLNAHYLPTGIDALRALPGASVSFAFSQAVLEHIRKGEYQEFLQQLYRILEPGSLSSHRVDLQDHLSKGLNNLRFSDRVWESDFFASSGFYTNRLGLRDHVEAFEAAGFIIEKLVSDRFPVLPLPRTRMATRFRTRSDEELLVCGFDIVVRKPCT